MVIYGEYLFLENLISGVLLLLLTGKLLGERIRKGRFLCAALLCGVSGFLLLVPPIGAAAQGLQAAAGDTGGMAPWLPVLHAIGGFAVRILAALLIPYLAFGANSLLLFLKKGVVFLGLTLLSGGAAMAFLLWRQIPAVSGNGSIYIEAVTYLQLLCWGILAFGLAWWFVRLIRLLRLSQWTEGELQVQMQEGGRTYRLHAAIDTANCLREPLSGSPVILLDRKAKKKWVSRGPLQHHSMPTALLPFPIGQSVQRPESWRACVRTKLCFKIETCRQAYWHFMTEISAMSRRW